MLTTLLSIEYAKLGVFFLFSFFLSIFLFYISVRLTINSPDSQKLSSYECGFEPYEDARNVFDVRFYLVAILYLIFDLEAVYFFPWCVSFSIIDSYGFFLMIDFLIELLIGYIYAWEIGALDWN
jgi:NADH-quinone oxidoreductase subunit A